MRLHLNPGLVIHPFDGAGHVPRVVCEIPHRSGRPVHVLMPMTIVSVLQKCEPADGISALAASMSEGAGGRVPASQCAALVREQLMPRGVIVDLDAELAESDMKRRDDYLTIKVRLLSRPIVFAIARNLVWLCKKSVVAFILAAVVLTHIFVIGLAYRDGAAGLAAFTAPSAIILMGLVSVQVLWHEIGHATALVKYGGQRPEIGWGLYLWYFVMFTDLSEAWQMPRKARFHIDLAGIYFQSMFLILFSLLWLSTHQNIWIYALYATDLHLAGNLNPFLRMDGYWALVDALGLTTLRNFSVARLLRKGDGAGRNRLPELTPLMKRIVGLYAVGSIAFYSSLLFILGREIYKFALTLPSLLLSWHHIDNSDLGRDTALHLAWKLLIFVLCCAILVRMAMRLMNAVLPEGAARPRSFFIGRRGVSRA